MARVTGVWLFHRAVATLVVTGSLTGVCLYMAQTGPADEKTIWFIIAGIIAAATLAFNGNSLRALWLSLNSKLHVGDILDIHGRPCYVLDVSLQGAKYMIRKGEHEPRSAFVDKSEGSISLEDFGRYGKHEDATPPCEGGCKKINWYCRCNPKAYS